MLKLLSDPPSIWRLRFESYTRALVKNIIADASKSLTHSNHNDSHQHLTCFRLCSGVDMGTWLNFGVHRIGLMMGLFAPAYSLSTIMSICVDDAVVRIFRVGE